jgi:hypothetical protein
LWSHGLDDLLSLNAISNIVVPFLQSYWEVDHTNPPIIPSGNGATNEAVTAINGNDGPVKVCYLTEQTSHHPPVSAFYIGCPQRGVSARGFDQINARFTGTSIRIGPGEHNLGIFVTLEKRDNEEYQLTHPAAHVGGLLRGSISISVAGYCYVTCPKTRIKAILQYMEEGWVGRSQHRVEGAVFRYDPENDDKTRIKDVPQGDVLARINGCWREQIYYTLASSSEPQLLIDVTPLFPANKIVPPEELQLRNESRKFWSEVTTAILEKQYSQATKLKQDIEERQRGKAAERRAKNEEWNPRFFTGAVTPLGKPDLNEEGKKAVRGLHEGDFRLEESKIIGA